MKAIVIPADGNCPARVVDEKLTLDFLQGAVGGLIEAVCICQVLTDSGMQSVDCTCLVNEDGKLDGLPVNARATDLAAVAIGGWVRDVIVGDVIVVGPPDSDGEETACPDQVIDIVRVWGWLDGR
jgi:hypothetical protein